MRYLTLGEVLHLHRRIIASSGGSGGIRDLGIIKSALAQPKVTFGGEDLYPSLSEKATALCYSLIRGHGFVDGNKRVAHAALEVFLILNGYELAADVDEQERVFLALAGGSMSRDELLAWVEARAVPR